MSLNEKTVYPQLPETIGADELTLHFTPTEEEIAFATKGARLPASRLSLLVLLKFQKLHRVPDPTEIAASVVDHLRIQLRLGAPVPFRFDNPVQRARLRTAIREYTGVMGWSRKARDTAAEAGFQAALIMARPADITNAIVAAITNARFELPAFSTVERITKRARARAQRKLCGSVFRRLTAPERHALDRLLVTAVDQRRTAFQAIKKLPQRPSRKHLRETTSHLEWLESLGSVGTELKEIAPALVRDFAKQSENVRCG